MKQLSDAQSLSEALTWTIQAKRITYRRYGLNGELRRPMVHRFEVKGGDNLTSVMAQNITRSNSLLARLSRAVEPE